MSENRDTSTPAGLVSAEPDQPAPAADDQKAALPAAAEATAETPKEETPEQIEERRKQKEREHNARRLQRKSTEAAEAKAEAKLLREENDRLRAEKAAAASKGSDEPKPDAFESERDYLRALARWEAAQVSQEGLSKQEKAQQGRDQQQRQAESEAKIAREWQAAEAEFQKSNKDYAEVVGPFVDGELQDLHQAAKTYIAESGPALLYDLATNPEEAARIAALSPTRQIAELGKREVALATKTAKPSNAPDPIKPLGQGRSGTKDPEKMSDSEYKNWRKSHGARWAQ